MRVLIAGCGYVGSALGELLASGGHTVFGLRRDPASLPGTIAPVAADLSRPVASETLPAALDYVYYTASAGSPDDAAYRAAYVDGPANLLKALAPQQAGVRRLFLTSSTGVYSQKNGEWVDEDSPTEPEGQTGRRLLQGERVVAEGPLPATVVRLSGIYGPGRTQSIARALGAVSDMSANATLDEGPPAYTNRIHRDDCAGVLRHLMSLPSPAPLYLATDCEPTDLRTVARWLSARQQESGPRQSGPRQSGKRRRANKRCNNRRLLASGYEFRYPTFREGFAGLLDEVWPDGL
ncbi:MAG: SDR family oxidoreductase [Rubrobacteraceae bacterium]